MGPQLRAYLERLPDGLASYPGCWAKASLYRSILEELPLDDARLPEPLQDLLRRPRAVTEWIPEVHSHAVLIAQYDQRFALLPRFAAHCYAAQRRLWDGKIYGFMMGLMSPARLLGGASQRWGRFHRGSELVAERTGDRSASLRLSAPPHLYDEITMIGLTEGLRAVIDCSGMASEFSLQDRDASGARWVVRW